MPKSQTDRHPDDLETEDVQRPDGEMKVGSGQCCNEHCTEGPNYSEIRVRSS